MRLLLIPLLINFAAETVCKSSNLEYPKVWRSVPVPVQIPGSSPIAKRILSPSEASPYSDPQNGRITPTSHVPAPPPNPDLSALNKYIISEQEIFSKNNPPPLPFSSMTLSHRDLPAIPVPHHYPDNSTTPTTHKEVHKFKLIPVLVGFGFFTIGILWIFLRVGFFRDIDYLGNVKRSFDSLTDILKLSENSSTLDDMANHIFQAFSSPQFELDRNPKKSS